MPSLSRELIAIAQRVSILENAAAGEKDEETVWRYYYDKGALDYRDKLMDFFGSQPSSRNALDVFHDFLNIFPDSYSDKQQ